MGSKVLSDPRGLLTRVYGIYRKLLQIRFRVLIPSHLGSEALRLSFLHYLVSDEIRKKTNISLFIFIEIRYMDYGLNTENQKRIKIFGPGS